LPQDVSVNMMAVAAKKESFFIFAPSNFVDSINQHDLFILIFYDFKQIFLNMCNFMMLLFILAN
jgi:hypothetical protein